MALTMVILFVLFLSLPLTVPFLVVLINGFYSRGLFAREQRRYAKRQVKIDKSLEVAPRIPSSGCACILHQEPKHINVVRPRSPSISPIVVGQIAAITLYPFIAIIAPPAFKIALTAILVLSFISLLLLLSGRPYNISFYRIKNIFEELGESLSEEDYQHRYLSRALGSYITPRVITITPLIIILLMTILGDSLAIDIVTMSEEWKKDNSVINYILTGIFAFFLLFYLLPVIIATALLFYSCAFVRQDYHRSIHKEYSCVAGGKLSRYLFRQQTLESGKDSSACSASRHKGFLLYFKCFYYQYAFFFSYFLPNKSAKKKYPPALVNRWIRVAYAPLAPMEILKTQGIDDELYRQYLFDISVLTLMREYGLIERYRERVLCISEAVCSPEVPEDAKSFILEEDRSDSVLPKVASSLTILAIVMALLAYISSLTLYRYSESIPKSSSGADYSVSGVARLKSAGDISSPADGSTAQPV